MKFSIFWKRSYEMKSYRELCSLGYISFRSSLLDNCQKLSRKQCGYSYLKPVLTVALVMFASVLSSAGASALELGASPAELVFEGKAGTLACANLSVESDRALRVVFEERWLVRNYAGGWTERPLLAGKALGLSVALPSSVELEFKGRREGKEGRWRALLPVCIVGEQAGEYAGLLFIMPEEGIAGVGVRMRVLLEGQGKEEERTTGAVLRLTRAEKTRSESNAEEENGVVFLLAEETLGLLLMGEVLRRAYRAFDINP